MLYFAILQSQKLPAVSKSEVAEVVDDTVAERSYDFAGIGCGKAYDMRSGSAAGIDAME